MEEQFKQITYSGLKIAIVGSESSGKTTLAEQLAKHFQVDYVKEFAREFIEKKGEDKKERFTQDDLVFIAKKQIFLENKKASLEQHFLICDTCVLETKVFQDVFYTSSNAFLDKLAKKHKYDLFFLTNTDVPWLDDSLRQGEEMREVFFNSCKETLENYQKPFIVLSGNKDKRFHQALHIIEELLKFKALQLSSFDFLECYKRGISAENISRQLGFLTKGLEKVNLNRAATINDGIQALTNEEAIYYVNLFEVKKKNIKLKKFVPASGAASRMFKFLNEFILEYRLGEESVNAYINRKKDKNLALFLVAKEKFPFYELVLNETKKTFSDYENWSKDLKDFAFIKTMLSPKGLNYSNNPKAVLPFHKYNNDLVTPLEEHLIESCHYLNSNGNAFLHFTVSEEHLLYFENILSETKPKIEQKYGLSIQVNLSLQDKSTDTVAVNEKNELVKDNNNTLVFRPGGHGALIKNLNQLEADIVFIKNIDNIIHDKVEDISFYKKMLGGILLNIQEQIFLYLRKLEQDNLTKEVIDEMVYFLTSKLKIKIPEEFSKYTREYKIATLKEMLNRPIRVCGMVKNEGEPGGGPFWVENKKGETFLQIIETSQIDLDDKNQVAILKSATHFNPVDLVCSIKDYRGIKFNLQEFVDENSGFIVEKNKQGIYIKGYELPGLWNGAMAKWLTLFVEVPLFTFNPVKTVNDLLKPAHQPQL